MSQTSIPRPLYHYSLPLFAVISLIMYLLAMRLVQPTRRWKMQAREVVVGLVTVLVVVGMIVLGFFLTAGRYEWARNAQVGQFNQVNGPMFANPGMPARAVEQAVVVPAPVDMVETPTPATPPGERAALELDEQAEIYAAAARQLYTIDHTFGDNPPNWPLLYLVLTTDDGVGDPNAEKGEPVQFQKDLLSGVSTRLNDLPTKLMWIENREAAKINPENGMVENGQGAIITFGNIYPQEDGTVHVSASLYFASLGATGKTYILTKVDGAWQITGSTGVEWIS